MQEGRIMKVLVVDDHPLIVEDILDEFKEIEPEAECMALPHQFLSYTM